MLEVGAVATVTILSFGVIDASGRSFQVRCMHSGKPHYLFGSRCLAALICVGLCNQPIASGSDTALGMVAEAQHAHLDGVSAVTGATIYAGDAVDTENPGVLRLRLGTGQFYLSASSAATLSKRSGVAGVKLVRGTANFSVPDSTQFELETPAGILRGSGQNPTRAQVTITGPRELVVSAIRGDLILDNDGELHTIPEGKSYRVVIEDEPGSPSVNDDTPKNTRHRKRKLLFFLLFGGALATVSAVIWRAASESPYKRL